MHLAKTPTHAQTPAIPGSSAISIQKRGAELPTKAAEQGLPAAQNGLGILYQQPGVTQNYEEAYFWLTVASQSGNKQSIPARDQAAQHLTPQQITDAEKRASEWKATSN
jgi:uncharacterized protein